MKDYSNTYWCHKGKHGNLRASLQELIPDEGKVPNHRKNRALEKFRIASNCYYDLYNNGLCNRAAEFRKVFGFGAYRSELTQVIIDRTDSRMDEIILAAYREQSCDRVIATDGTDWGHWTGDKFTPCSKIHPGQLVQECARRLIKKA